MNDKQKRIKKISIDKDASIFDALKKMDITFKRLLLVFDNQKFLNVLSIGDVQRAIIQNISLKSSVHEILRKET